MPFPQPIETNLAFLTRSRVSTPWEIHVTEIGYCHTKNLLKGWLRKNTTLSEKLKEEVPLYIKSAQVWHRLTAGWMAGETCIDFMKGTDYPPRKIKLAGQYEGDDVFITGQADWLEDDNVKIGELKNTKGLSYIRKQGVSFQYELQGILYCKLYNINKMHWYFTDWYSDVIEIEEEYDQETIDEIWEWSCGRAINLYKARKEKILISTDVDFKDKEQGWQCAPYCPFTTYCHPSFPFHQKSHKGRKLKEQWRRSLVDPDVISTILYEKGIVIPNE